MSIIKPEIQQHKITIEDVINQVKSINASLYKEIIDKHTAGFNKVWNNPMFTPKEIVDAFGTEAIALFMLSGALQNILKNADPNYEVLMPPYAFTVNQDGSVSVGEKL